MNSLHLDKDKLFSNSITEFVLIIAFVFVIVAVGFKDRLDVVLDGADISEEDILELVDIRSEINQLEESLGMVSLKNLSLSEKIERIRSSMPRDFKVDGDWQNLYMIKDFLNENKDYAENLNSLVKNIKDLENRNKLLSERTKKAGLGKQPCEVSADGTVYLASLTLFDDEIRFKKLSLHPLNEYLPLESEMSYSDFSKLAKVYYSWSNTKPQDCRFFVKVIDNSTTKEKYKSALVLIEKYFYKYETRS